MIRQLPRTERYSLSKEALPIAIISLVAAVLFFAGFIFLLYTMPIYHYPIVFILFIGLVVIGFIALSITMFRLHQSITINYSKKTIKVDRVYTRDEISHLIYFKKNEKYIVPDLPYNSMKVETGSIYCFGMVLKNDEYEDYDKVPLANVVLIDKDIDIAKMYKRSLTVSREFGLDFVDYINECLFQNGELKEKYSDPLITKSDIKKIVEKDVGADKSKVYVYGDDWNKTIRYFLPPIDKGSNLFMILILLGLGILFYFMFSNISLITSIITTIFIGGFCLFFVYLEYYNKRGNGWNRIEIKNDFLFYRDHEGRKRRTKLSDISTILNLFPNSYNLLIVEKSQNATYLGCRHSGNIQRLLNYQLHKHLLLDRYEPNSF